MPRWWPGSGGDNPEGKYAEGTVPQGRPPSTENIVKEILKDADPVQGIRIKDIAEQIGQRRDGPNALPFEGKNKKQLHSQAGKILRKLEAEGEVEQRGERSRGSAPSEWALVAGPKGGPKPKGWTGGHARAGEGKPERRWSRGHSLGIGSEARRHSEEPSGDVEADRRRRREQSQRRSDPTNPENFRKSGGRGKTKKDEPDRRPFYEKQADKKAAKSKQEPDRRPFYEKQADQNKGGSSGGSGGSVGLGSEAKPAKPADKGGKSDDGPRDGKFW